MLSYNYEDKIDYSMEFNAIQFYLKSADRDTWADKQTVEHTLNIKEALSHAHSRMKVINHQETQQLSLKDVDK